MNLKSTAKYPRAPVGADNVSCYFIQHTFLYCMYCCGLWLSCRGLGRWLLSVTRGRWAAPLRQKWMCAGWCALLWRWHGNILQVTPVLLYQKTAMHVEAGGKVCLESGTYTMWLALGFGHCKEVYNDADVQRLPRRRSEPIPGPLLTSLTVHTLILWSGQYWQWAAARRREVTITFPFHSIALPVFHLPGYLTYISSSPK